MSDHTIEGVRGLSREQLEDLTVQAIIRIRQDKQERSRNSAFLAVLTGFMLGSLIAAGGFAAGMAIR
jgi:hypothetical protein